MARLCERPGCSEPGAAAYGMVPEDLLFWIAALGDEPTIERSVLCRRHADAMVVPRGWTLDDRRDPSLHLFNPRTLPNSEAPTARRRRTRRRSGSRHEQLRIDGTGEIARPVDTLGPKEVEPVANAPAEPAPPWQPDFDHDDDLGGLLEVRSPLLARAFRGHVRPKR